MAREAATKGWRTVRARSLSESDIDLAVREGLGGLNTSDSWILEGLVSHAVPYGDRWAIFVTVIARARGDDAPAP